MKVTHCQLCKSEKLELVLDLGLHPLADTFLSNQKTAQELPRYPLQILLCLSCGHAMNSFVVPKEERYQEHDYSYDSSNSETAIAHFDEIAREAVGRVKLTSEDLVVDIGGNVGTLLKALNKHSGARMLNIEPARNIVELAQRNGVPTIPDFWGAAPAGTIKREGGAKIITITNAFNHIDALDEFMEHIQEALHPSGIFVIEVPYLKTLIEHDAFDTMYLEHVSYFSVRPLRQYFATCGLQILEVSHNDYMGGSLRLVVGRGKEGARVAQYVAEEEAFKLFDPITHSAFRTRVEHFKEALLSQLKEAKAKGGKIIGVGAATKGNTLLNYCGIDTNLLEFITDASPLKVGKYTPGTAIPINSDEAITDEITHALILPWNIAELLLRKLEPLHPNLAFIVPHMA